MDFTKELKAYEQEFITKLTELCSFKSVFAEGEDFPFGNEIDKALKYTLKLAESYGFKTFYQKDGMYGYAEFGEGKEMLGILGHLDVVPAGDLEAWDTDPYKATLKGRKLYARGTQDDKGPIIASMLAMKVLMDKGHKFNKRVRFIFGLDEETLWRSINEYVKHEEIPTYAFTPDSGFPLTYAEKGLLQAKLTSKNPFNRDFNLGDAFNAVPSNIKVDFNDKEELDFIVKNLEKNGFEHSVSGTTLEVVGKASHASKTDQGINSIKRLISSMKENNIVNFVNEFLNEDPYATKIFGDVQDDISGKLMFNLGKIATVGDNIELCVDIRIPVKTDKDEMVKLLEAKASEYGLVYSEYDWLRSIYLDLDTPFMKTLMDTYAEVTGDTKSKPISSGGATYARSMDNCVAFGPALVGAKKVEHMPNEYVDLDDIVVAANLYAVVIQKLTK